MKIFEIISPMYLFIYFVIVNIISIIMFYLDKDMAIKHEYRIPEKTLITLCIIGGGVGSLFAMYKFRHKVKKNKFAFGIPLIMLIQVTLIIYLTINNYIIF